MNNFRDLSLIELSDYEQKLFNRFKNKDTAKFTIEEFDILVNRHLVKDGISGKSSWFGYEHLPKIGICEISELGKRLRTHQLHQQRREKKEDRRYLITTMIAIVALIKSFLPEILALLAWLMKLLMPR